MVRHTQGSGKSLTMVFYAGRIIRHPEMGNPTILVLTDRNDLDGQLFGVFSCCRDLLGKEPIQAESRAELRELLQGGAGGRRPSSPSSATRSATSRTPSGAPP